MPKGQAMPAITRTGARATFSFRDRYWRLRHSRHDAGGDDVGGDAGEDRQRIAVADVEGEPGGAGADQGAERHARVENADDAADVPTAEIVHDERRQERDEAAVEDAVGKRKGGERPQVGREGPYGLGERHAHEHRQERARAAHAVGEAAENEAPGGAADADHAEEQDGRRRGDAVIPRVGDEVDERDEQPERADQAGGVEAGEAAGSYRRAHGGPG